MVEQQLCKLRGTSDTFVGRVYYIFDLLYGVVVLSIFPWLSSVAHYSGELPVAPVCARKGHQHYSEAPALL